MKKTIPNIEALKIIEESIKAGNNIRLTVRGNSMSPLLLDDIDKITLLPFINEDLKKGDIILFRYGEAPKIGLIKLYARRGRILINRIILHIKKLFTPHN